MKVTRSGFFETNSSSTHSITIRPSDVVDTIPTEADGVVRIRPGEFGWDVADHFDAQTKASYCLTYVKTVVDAERLERMLHAVICGNLTRPAPVEFTPLPDRPWHGVDQENWGYIDHQSADVARAAFKSPTALRDFIFSSRSVLHTDNDNY